MYCFTSICCLSLCHWPIAYMMMPADLIMGLSAWQPLAHHCHCPRCKHWMPAHKFLHRRARNISGVYIFSFIKLIQLEFLYDIVKGVFLIGTKFRSNMRQVVESNYALLQRTYKESANVFSCMCEHLTSSAVPGWVKERILEHVSYKQIRDPLSHVYGLLAWITLHCSSGKFGCQTVLTNT